MEPMELEYRLEEHLRERLDSYIGSTEIEEFKKEMVKATTEFLGVPPEECTLEEPEFTDIIEGYYYESSDKSIVINIYFEKIRYPIKCKDKKIITKVTLSVAEIELPNQHIFRSEIDDILSVRIEDIYGE